MRGLTQFVDPIPPRSPALLVTAAARACRPVGGAPQLSHVSGELLRKIEVLDEYEDHRAVDVPVERPLAVMLDSRNVGTLLTLGASPEWLVLGYLWHQRLIGAVTDVVALDIDWADGSAVVRTRSGRSVAREVPAPVLRPTGFTRSRLLAIQDGVPQRDAIYQAAGSVHGCALFSGSDLWLSIEDVSPDNAIDTIIGWMVLHGIEDADKVLFTTGRFSAEMIMKAARSGIPTLISRKGVTAASYDLAQRLGMTLLGHAERGHYMCYAGAERFDARA